MKFDPTDQELIEHLEAKVEAKDMKPHPLIDEFIPTIEGEDGICYTHPEKLPGLISIFKNKTWLGLGGNYKKKTLRFIFFNSKCDISVQSRSCFTRITLY